MKVILFRYGWLVLLAVGPLNAWVFWRRARPYVSACPELKVGYRRLIRGYVFWLSLPWLVMGFGCLVGGVPTFLHFLFPATGGPFAWAWWVVLYAEWLLLGYWVVWGNGAEVLARHPGIFGRLPQSAKQIRWNLAGTVMYVIVLYTTFLVWVSC